MSAAESSGESSSGDYFGGAVDMLDVRDSTILRTLSFIARAQIPRTNHTMTVAEDSPDLRSYIQGLLSKHYNVVQVADGQAALEIALLHPPSLVLVRSPSHDSSRRNHAPGATSLSAGYS